MIGFHLFISLLLINADLGYKNSEKYYWSLSKIVTNTKQLYVIFHIILLLSVY